MNECSSKKVLIELSFTYPAQKIVQVDSEKKDLGYSHMIQVIKNVQPGSQGCDTDLDIKIPISAKEMHAWEELDLAWLWFLS